MTNQISARNTLTGKVGLVPRGYLTHPVLGLTLVPVEEGAKDYDPKFYVPKTRDEFLAEKPWTAPTPDADIEEPDENDIDDDTDAIKE